ncbi:hypothetical protein DFQ27_005487 [Actinomortierella ambigua]|uniref:Vacuolar ATPase assembly protein VMA22 n=1 Tax=Actinomortierella ambigua TaxID=1343610 RepID=A0A9P6Q1V8_9FUNG|nr:hypothetical protein DFQ27_005487 [Actinomortierella ambigua]
MDTATQLTTQEDVCARLDELVLEYMHLVDTHLNAMATMTKHLQEGREQIAQAKYIMGPRNVSSDCYDNRMKALVGLSVTEDGRTSLTEIPKEIHQLDQDQDHQTDGQEHGVVPNETSVDHQGLRRRGGGREERGGRAEGLSWDVSNATATRGAKIGAESAAAATDNGDDEDVDTQADKAEKKEASRDPLRWFGVFAPAPLRNAQSSFRGGLQDMSELMTIRLQLLAIERQIRTLEQRKTDVLPMVA